MDEKRKVERYGVNIPVCSNGFMKGSSHIITDISTNGAFITTKKPLRIGSKLCLNFTLPWSQKKISVNGAIVWNKPKDSKNPGMGVEFIGLRESDFDAVLKFLEDLYRGK